MANHKSSEKRIRQTEVRTERNRARKAKIKTLTKKVHGAIEAGDTTAIKDTLNQATRSLQRVAGKGTLHKNTVARRISRLARTANKATASQAASK